MTEIRTAATTTRSAVQIGDVVRYDGTPPRHDQSEAWQELAAEQPHPMWVYDPISEDDDGRDPWALLVTDFDYWEQRWGWEDLPPAVTLILRDGQPVAGTDAAGPDGAR